MSDVWMWLSTLSDCHVGSAHPEGTALVGDFDRHPVGIVENVPGILSGVESRDVPGVLERLPRVQNANRLGIPISHEVCRVVSRDFRIERHPDVLSSRRPVVLDAEQYRRRAVLGEDEACRDHWPIPPGGVAPSDPQRRDRRKHQRHGRQRGDSHAVIICPRPEVHGRDCSARLLLGSTYRPEKMRLGTPARASLPRTRMPACVRPRTVRRARSGCTVSKPTP